MTFAIYDNEAKQFYHGQGCFRTYPKVWNRRSSAVCALSWLTNDWEYDANHKRVKVNHHPNVEVIEVSWRIYRLTRVEEIKLEQIQ